MANRLIDNKAALFRRLKREIKDNRVIDAMERVPREMFVPPQHRAMAYADALWPLAKVKPSPNPSSWH